MSSSTLEQKQRYDEATKDLESLGRVSHRLAMTPSDSLEKVLDKLLPRLLSRIGSNHALLTNNGAPVYEKIHAKLVEMLSHVMKRVRQERNCQLPCAAMLNLLIQETKQDELPLFKSDVDPFTLNLSLTFLTLGMGTCQDLSQLSEMIPNLLVLVGAHYSSNSDQSKQLHHLLLRAIQQVVILSENTTEKQQDSLLHLQLARRVVAQDAKAGAAFYQFMLDVLLYQQQYSTNNNNNNTMPPPGLSQNANLMLTGGASSTHSNWKEEMAVFPKLKELKVALLKYIAPHLQWDIFGYKEATANDSSKDETNSLNDNCNDATIQTVSQDDTAMDIATDEPINDWGMTRMVSLLVVASGDAHLDVADMAQGFLKSHMDSYSSRQVNDKTHALAALGNHPQSLSSHLLSLTLGQANAESVSADASWTFPTADLNWKRRMVSDSNASAICNFVASTLDNNPHLLLGDSKDLSYLAVAVCRNFLRNYSQSTTVMSSNPMVASAKLLNALTVRLASGTDVNELLGQSLNIACNVLAVSSSSSSAKSSNEGILAIRDACYGVVCTACRCTEYSSMSHGQVFAGGAASATTTANQGQHAVSIETAALLFGCASNEIETLRPRAVAALDALLSAYCRLYEQKAKDEDKMEIDEPLAPEVNPWTNQSVATSPSNSTAQRYSNSQLLLKSLLPLLWTAAQSSQTKASRVAATRWASDLVKLLDLSRACHLLCFLSGDVDVTASSIARGGLGLGKEADEEEVVDFKAIVSILLEKEQNARAVSWRPTYYDFTDKGKAATVAFILKCLFRDLYGGEDQAVETYVVALTQTLSGYKAGSATNTTGSRDSINLLDEASVCLAGCLSTSQFSRSMIVTNAPSLNSFGLVDIEHLVLSVDSSKARRHLALSCGSIYQDYNLWLHDLIDQDKSTLAEYIKLSNISRPLETSSEKLTGMQSNLFMAGQVHGAALLGAHCVKSFRLLAAKQSLQEDISTVCWEHCETILSGLGRGTLHSDEVVGNVSSQALTIALGYNSVDAPILDPRLYNGCSTALECLCKALGKYGNGDHTDPSRATLLAEASGVALAATTSGAGHVSTSDSLDLGPARIQCLDALFSILGSSSFRKDPEITLVVGEALARYADAFSPEGAVWSFEAATWPDNYTETYASDLPPHQQVLYVLLRRELNSSSPHKKTSCATALLAVVGRAARLVNGDVALAKRAFVREIFDRLADVQAAFITLLAYPKSKQLARESCCLGLSSCQGLADAVAGCKDANVEDSKGKNLNDRLLVAFGQTTNRGGSAMMETRSQEAERRQRENNEEETSASTMMESFGMDVEVGGASGMGEAALGAYREMASAAVSLGRPDVLYALMCLSVSHPVWRTEGVRDRYSACALLGETSIVGNRTNVAAIRTALRPHLNKLIPRLLRACNDPNKQTREQMNALWVGITGGGVDARLAITQNLLSTIDVLIEEASSKLWRARVGACGALSDVIVGRSWDELGGGGAVLDDDDVLNPVKGASSSAGIRLLRLWRVAMRALDDVRLTVRESGETLARSVRSLTIRLIDPSVVRKPSEGVLIALNQGEKVKVERDASVAAATALRWLVKHGLNQACAEATGACVSCLLGIVDVVKPNQLQPVLPELIGALLMAMSGLEPAALNYLQVRTAGDDATASGGTSYDRLERVRLQMAQSGPIAGALTKCLDMMKLIDVEAQRAVIPELDSALRRGAGFATRAAAADAVSSLCATCPGAFKFAGQSSTNPTVRLLRAFYFAGERERGSYARDKMAHALGNLAALAPGASVRSLAVRACERYSLAQGNNDDPAARRAAAAALRAIAVRATAQFGDGGVNDVWSRQVLPIAYLGQRDSDVKVASLWKEVWEEGGSAANVSSLRSGSSDSFGVTLEEKLLPDLVRACDEALQDVSWSRRVAGCSALVDLCELNVLAPAPRAVTPGSSRNSPEPDLLRAKRRAEASNVALRACVDLIMRPRIWKGKNEVVKASAKISGKWTVVGAGGSNDVYGWDGTEPICPWAPLIVGAGATDDLFVGDQWFASEHQGDQETSESPIVEPGAKSSSEELESESEEIGKIDFAECDAALGDKSTPMAIEKTTPKSSSRVLTFSGYCRALLLQGMPVRRSFSSSPEDILPYRSAALQGLSDLLRSLGSDAIATEQLRKVYKLIAPTLIGVADSEKMFGIEMQFEFKNEPLIVARSVDCLSAAFWEGIGGGDVAVADPSKIESVQELSYLFCSLSGQKQPAWTVRESALLGAASLASQADARSLRKHEIISTFVDCTSRAVKDRKFWRVRYAGVKLLHSVVGRAGSGNDHSVAFSIPRSSVKQTSPSNQDRQLLLESMLPHKEKILRIARACLSDSEVKVTSIATEVISCTSWWP